MNLSKILLWLSWKHIPWSSVAVDKNDSLMLHSTSCLSLPYHPLPFHCIQRQGRSDSFVTSPYINSNIHQSHITTGCFFRAPVAITMFLTYDACLLQSIYRERFHSVFTIRSQMTSIASSSHKEAGTSLFDSTVCRKPLPPRSKARARLKGLFTRCVTFILMIAITLPIIAGCLLPLLNGPVTNGCLPSGDYAGIDGSARFNPWVDSEFFTITIAFGTFKLSTVKLLNVIWDVIVGRCGQSLLAVVTFQVFTKSVVHTMEKRAVSYQTFAVLSLKDPSLETILVMVKEWSFRKGL